MKKIIIFFTLIITISSGINFKRAVIIYGSHGMARAIGYDTDHDSKMNLVFHRYIRPDTNAICFFEHAGYDRYVIEGIVRFGCLWDIGDLDGDSLTDMVVDVTDSLLVYESPDPHSNPTTKVWFYRTGGNSESPTRITDLDKDGKKEILTKALSANSIFECIGNNQYRLVHQDTNCPQNLNFAVADYDCDGRIEYAGGGGLGGSLYPNVFVYECVTNDSFILTFLDTIPSAAGIDVVGCNDLDKDGKPEFIITYFHNIGSWLFNAWMFESIGDNLYEATLVDTMRAPLRCSYSWSSNGDIDSDGQEEFVWSTSNNWHIYKAIGNNKLQRIYSAYPVPQGNKNMVENIDVYDLNGNGYPEIIESYVCNNPPYSDTTIIWEIEGVRLHRPNGGEVLIPSTQFPITWEKFTPPGADSFMLFISFDNGRNYQTITTIQQSNDTLFLWHVPDSLSDSCKIMIWAYGPPRAGEDKPRGTAWDFSDSVFAIRQTGITEDTRCRIQDAGLKILQNPALSKDLRIRYSVPRAGKVKLTIYNALGQVERSLVDGGIAVGWHEQMSKRKLKSGIYFVSLKFENRLLTKKLIVIE